jgi:hypothetical protein
MEKTMLPLLRAWRFSHSLHPEPTYGVGTKRQIFTTISSGTRLSRRSTSRSP